MHVSHGPPCETAFSLNAVKAAHTAMRRITDHYRASRDYTLLDLRSQGYVAFALDRGHGEEWVLDDSLVDALQRQFPLVKDDRTAVFPGLFDVTGIRIYRWTEYVRGEA